MKNNVLGHDHTDLVLVKGLTVDSQERTSSGSYTYGYKADVYEHLRLETAYRNWCWQAATGASKHAPPDPPEKIAITEGLFTYEEIANLYDEVQIVNSFSFWRSDF